MYIGCLEMKFDVAMECLLKPIPLNALLRIGIQQYRSYPAMKLTVDPGDV